MGIPTPRAALFTNEQWMASYQRLEEFELDVRIKSQDANHSGIEVWMRQLALFQEGVVDVYQRGELSREGWQALHFRLHVLGLAISTSKFAMDGMLGGHYNGSLALCRNLLETWRRVAYVRLSPDDIWRWYPQKIWPDDVAPKPEWKKPPFTPTACGMKSKIESVGGESDKAMLGLVQTGFATLNQHVHPTIEGATQNWNNVTKSGGAYPRYNSVLADRCLLLGLYANHCLVNEFALLRNQSETWLSERAGVDEAMAQIVQDLQVRAEHWEKADNTPVKDNEAQ